MNKILRIAFKWILYITVPLLLFKILLYVLFTFAGDLPLKIIGILIPPQKEIIYTQLEEVFMYKASFIIGASIFFTVLLCSIFLLLISRYKIVKSLIANFAASCIGLVVGFIVFYMTLRKKPIYSIENLHAEIIPYFGVLGIVVMTVFLKRKSIRADKSFQTTRSLRA